MNRYICNDTELLLSNGLMKNINTINVGEKLMNWNNIELEVIGKELVKKKTYTIILSAKYDAKKQYKIVDFLTLRWNCNPSIEANNKSKIGVIFYTQGIENGLFYLQKERQKIIKDKTKGEDVALTEAKEFISKVTTDTYIHHQCTPMNYILLTRQNKHCLKLFTSEYLSFKNQTKELDFDPYILGAWLGDGTSRDSGFTSADSDVTNEMNRRLKRYAMEVVKIILPGDTYDKYHWKMRNIKIDGKIVSFPCQKCDYVGESREDYNKHVSKKSHIKMYGIIPLRDDRSTNDFITFIKNNDLKNNKHIPDHFKFSSKENRLQLLAGLLDTDGHLGNETFYEITQKNKRLANDIAFVARSLGYYVHSVECEKSHTYKGEKKFGLYQRMTICGTPNSNLNEIPVALERKKYKFNKKNTQNKLHHSFTLEENKEKEDCWKLTFSDNGLLRKDLALINSDFLII